MRALAGGRLTRHAALGMLAGSAVAAAALPEGFTAVRLGGAALSVMAASAALKAAGYWWSVGGRIESDRRSVRLTGVHPRFAEAVRTQYEQRARPSADEDSDVRIIPAAEARRRLAVAAG